MAIVAIVAYQCMYEVCISKTISRPALLKSRYEKSVVVLGGDERVSTCELKNHYRSDPVQVQPTKNKVQLYICIYIYIYVR